VSRITMIHTVGGLVPVFGKLSGELLPGVETGDVVDEALLKEAIAAGSIPPATAERLEGHVRAALDEGADLVVVTCSSMGPVVDEMRARTRWPLLRIDEAMADRAIELGRRIGVVATLSTTLEPTVGLIQRRATEQGAAVEVVAQLAEGAFAALQAGEVARHDELVRDALRAVLPSVDVVVLAQASMARVADTLGDEAGTTPILASPRLGVERVGERLRAGS
jgi:Asp/Glu/hydantoin racemase